jgi:hypothetical protein
MKRHGHAPPRGLRAWMTAGLVAASLVASPGLDRLLTARDRKNTRPHQPELEDRAAVEHVPAPRPGMQTPLLVILPAVRACPSSRPAGKPEGSR